MVTPRAGGRQEVSRNAEREGASVGDDLEVVGPPQQTVTRLLQLPHLVTPGGHQFVIRGLDTLHHKPLVPIKGDERFLLSEELGVQKQSVECATKRHDYTSPDPFEVLPTLDLPL